MLKMNFLRLKMGKTLINCSPFVNKRWFCQPQIKSQTETTQPKSDPQSPKVSEAVEEQQKQNKMYTKRGDRGTSHLFTGERRPKNDLIFEVLGETDELSSIIGLACEFAAEKNHKHKYLEQLETIQCTLQDIVSIIGSPTKKVDFPPTHATKLEQWIDEHSSELSPKKEFILPSGGTPSAWLHIARSQCRTAERRIVTLTKIDEEAVNEEVLRYYNRLGDYLFTTARLAAQLDEKHEKIYRVSKPPGEGT